MNTTGWIGNYSHYRARINPDSEAVYDIDRDLHVSYAELDERAARLAGYFDKIGLKKGDRVAMICRNGIEMIDAYYGTAKKGLILVPYNSRLSEDELSRLIAAEEPRLLIYETIFSGLVKALKGRTGIERLLAVSSPDGQGDDLGSPVYDDVLAEASPAEALGDIEMEDIHLIIHTGGTTGLPKGAMISHRALLFNAMNEICTWGISHRDSAHILLPLFHTGGWNLLTLPILHAGGRIMLNRQFNPELALRLINERKPSFIFGAATIFRMMAGEPLFDKTDFSSVKWIMAGAAPTPRNIMEKFWDKGVPFVLGYGMTEAGPNNLTAPAEFMSREEMKEKYAAVGRPMYLTLAKVVDEAGKELGPNETGELIWSGPQIFSGYWKNPEETAKTLRNNWVYTGDMAQYDDDGYFYIVGRKKNMYISGGENVFPPEVENVLYKIPEIHEVCVIGVPDEKWGEVGKAVVALKPGQTVDKAAVKQYLQSHLAGYKVPRYIVFVDAVPKNSVGKIVAAEVQRLYGKPGEEDA